MGNGVPVWLRRILSDICWTSANYGLASVTHIGGGRKFGDSCPGYPRVQSAQIRRELPDIPVIILTGQDRDVDVTVSLNEGANVYIEKLFNQVELVARKDPLIHIPPCCGEPC